MSFARACNKVSFRRFIPVVFACLMVIIFSSALLRAQTLKGGFFDEFNGESGESFDGTKWTAETGGGGWGNEELQYYTGEIDNVRLDGKGNIELRAVPLGASSQLTCWYGKCQFTSARLITKGKYSFRYGRAEARIKVPKGVGVWPAFWMLGDDIDKAGWPNCGEIDIMEFIGREPSTVYGTVHGPGYSGGNGISRSFSLRNSEPLSSDFHTFAAEWTDDRISWFVDGKLYGSVSRKDLPKGTKWVFDHSYFLILNFAVGGKWPGSPTASSSFPQSMLIDYVRVTPLQTSRPNR